MGKDHDKREMEIEFIEMRTGVYGTWHEWSDEALEKMYNYVRQAQKAFLKSFKQS